MNRLLIKLFLIVLTIPVFSQDYSIEGTIVDEDKTPLLGATIVILDSKDSTMLAFGISDDEGRFKVFDVPGGELILQASYTGFTDHGQVLNLNSDQRKHYTGEIVMKVSSAILEEVSIKAEHIPMGILGDTINYNAAAFKTQPGASVEDLLKKLPGIEVARDGSLKAQGKDVENVLVDGKEFFSGDATIATKNLEAEAVDKVQVYDKKSEEAEFTGIDDGQEEKTINLKLKDGYKNGGFGKASIDAGTEGTREAKLNYNRFSPTVQASIIGNTNNINNQAFSFSDYIDFMGGFQNVLAAGGLNEYGVTMGNPRNQEGIRDQHSVGSNLNVDFSKKMELNANYLFANNNLVLDQSGTTENFTNDESFSTIDTSMSNNKTTNHRLNTKLRYKPNPFNAFTWDMRFFTIGANNISNSATEYLVNGASQNTSTSANNLSSSSFNISSSLQYRKKYQKKGRNWISNLSYEQMDQDEETDINNAFRSMTLEELIDQFQMFSNKRKTLRADSKFTEPIGKKLYLGLDYALNNVNQQPSRDYFNRVEDELILDPEISSQFESDWLYNRAGIFLKRNRKKTKINAALRYAVARLRAMDNGVQLNDQESFGYLLPSFSLNYKMKSSKSIEFGYTTRLSAPQLAQMVTQVNNLNPNFIILGNPDLEPEYVHTLNLHYSAFDQFNFSSQFANLSVSFSPNKIVNSRNLRSDLVTEIVPVNAGKHMSANLYFSHNAPIRKLKIKYNINANMTYSRFNTLINDLENQVSEGMANLNFGIENRNKDVLDIAGGIRLDLSAFSNSFNSNFSEPFVNYSWYLDTYVIMGKGFNLGVTYDYRTFNGGFFNDNQVQHLLGAKFSKTMLDNKLTLSVSAHDLLNQNKGIGRSGNINTLSDTRFNALGRYVMVGVSYRLGMVRDNGIDIDM